MEEERDEPPEVFGEREPSDDQYERYFVAPLPGERRQGWGLLGKVVAVVLIVCGLALIGFMVLFLIALNSWGSNK